MTKLTYLGIVLALAALVLELIPTNVYVLRPGQALNVSAMVTVKGYPPRHKAGRLYMTDVYLQQVQHKLEELFWRLDPNAEVDPAQTVTSGLNNQQYTELNLDMMQNAVQDAEAAALRVALGYKPHYATTGPEVQVTMNGTPAAKYLKQGDIIVAANGKRVTGPAGLQAITHRLRPGQHVRLTVKRHGKVLQLAVPTIAATNGIPTKGGKTPLIGVFIAQPLALPVKIFINSGDIGGPSAGLMFTLGIIQRIEKRDITKGCVVAGTGTIDINGNVGAIGGAKQKIIAARGVGAKYFLVPDDPTNVRDAMAGRGGVVVKPVKTLQQAMNFLKRIPACSK